VAFAIAALERKSKAEPVAWAYVNLDSECEQIEWGQVFDDPHVMPLYASPQKEALTAELGNGAVHPPRQDGSGSSRDFPASQVRDIPEGWVMAPKRIPQRIYNDMLAAQHNTLLKWGRASFELNLPITAQTASRALEAALTVLYAASPPAPESKS
jgi:hypothetical protein